MKQQHVRNASNTQATGCRIGLDLLSKLLGTAGWWSDKDGKESQSDCWLHKGFNREFKYIYVWSCLPWSTQQIDERKMNKRLLQMLTTRTHSKRVPSTNAHVEDNEVGNNEAMDPMMQTAQELPILPGWAHEWQWRRKARMPVACSNTTRTRPIIEDSNNRWDYPIWAQIVLLGKSTWTANHHILFIWNVTQPILSATKLGRTIVQHTARQQQQQGHINTNAIFQQFLQIPDSWL